MSSRHSEHVFWLLMAAVGVVAAGAPASRVGAQAGVVPPVGAKTALAKARSPSTATKSSKKLEPIESLRAALASGDAAKAGAALDALGTRSDRAAVDTLRAFLVVGQADIWADRAIAALGATRSADARPLLAELTQHRRTAARALAHRGLAQIPGEPSDALLAQGLRDSAAEVRGLCATQLGERNARPYAPLLLRALERGVPEAAVAIGKLGDAEMVVQYGALLQRLPIQVMLSGYGEFLRRADLSEATKLEIVARLGEVAGAVVKAFLTQLVVDDVGKGTPTLELALRETAKRIDAGGQRVAPAQGAVPAAPAQPAAQPTQPPAGTKP